jgi:hypothetical protein
MEFPIQPGERRQARHAVEPQPEEDDKNILDILSHPVLVVVLVTLNVIFACSIARLALVGQLNTFWEKGVPTLCSGVIATLPYESLGTSTAFIFESISNALAIQSYNVSSEDVCHTTDYSLDLSNHMMHSAYAYLTAVGILNILLAIPIQGYKWWTLFAKGSKLYSFRWSLVPSFIIVSLDTGAIYEAKVTKSSRILGLSIVIP